MLVKLIAFSDVHLDFFQILFYLHYPINMYHQKAGKEEFCLCNVTYN